MGRGKIKRHISINFPSFLKITIENVAKIRIDTTNVDDDAAASPPLTWVWVCMDLRWVIWLKINCTSYKYPQFVWSSLIKRADLFNLMAITRYDSFLSTTIEWVSEWMSSNTPPPVLLLLSSQTLGHLVGRLSVSLIHSQIIWRFEEDEQGSLHSFIHSSSHSPLETRSLVVINRRKRASSGIQTQQPTDISFNFLHSISHYDSRIH